MKKNGKKWTKKIEIATSILKRKVQVLLWFQELACISFFEA
jgi:hypothetical protein